jgi:hypothetical protein
MPHPVDLKEIGCGGGFRIYLDQDGIGSCEHNSELSLLKTYV